MEGKDKTKEIEESQKKKIRVTLTSRNVKNIESCSNELVKRAKEGENISVKGPVRMPTKNLKMTIRKSPCGEGSKTWDRFELRIHKRVIDFVCTLTQLKQITSIQINPGVDVELNFNQTDDQQ